MASGTSLVREKRQYTLLSSELTKFNGKCHSGLTGFDAKVRLISYCIEDKVRQNCRGDPPVESRGSERTPLLSKLLLREESRCGWIHS